MANASIAAADDLAFKARQGDIESGIKLIKLCREGMVKPYWEEEPMLDEEAVKRHLAKRVETGSGRMFG